MLAEPILWEYLKAVIWAQLKQLIAETAFSSSAEQILGKSAETRDPKDTLSKKLFFAYQDGKIYE